VSDLFERLWARARRVLVVVGALALAIGTVAAIVVVATLFRPPSGQDGQGAPDVRGGDVPPAPQFAASSYRQSQFPPLDEQPLLGVNYTHHTFRDCSLNGTAILRTYSNPGVAERVHSQLYDMRRAGVATIRTIVWHVSDATRQTWGPVSSANGELAEPYRTNLIRYLRELRRFGFARVTLSFGPQQQQNPLRLSYSPSYFEENWRFIGTVRAILKRHGPDDTRIDLLNEGAPSEAPSEWSPAPRQTADYLRRLYSLYVGRYGNRDVTVSTIAWDPTYRMRYLVRILKASGRPLPRWYDIHIGYNGAQATYALGETRRVLDANGVRGSLVVGETGYDNVEIARSLDRFLQSASRPVQEVSPWYVRTQQGCQVPPPYEPGAYEQELHDG
jgi:hypothetical protein